MSFQTSDNIYGVMQCAPDMVPILCGKCLYNLLEEKPGADLVPWGEGGSSPLPHVHAPKTAYYFKKRNEEERKSVGRREEEEEPLGQCL